MRASSLRVERLPLDPMARQAKSGSAEFEPSPPKIVVPLPDRREEVTLPVAVPSGHLVFLPPDWLPKALIGGDAVIVVLALLIGYWYRHNLDPIRQQGGE